MTPTTATPDNPLLRFGAMPRFDLIRPSHAEPAIRAILEGAAAGLAVLEAAAEPTWTGLMAPLYRIGEPLDYAWGLVHHYMGVLNSPEWRAVQEELQPDVVAFSLRVRQSEPLYRAMLALRDGPERARLTGPQQRILEAAVRGAELGGIGLAGAARERFNAVVRELAECATKFNNNLLDATKAFGLLLDRREDVAGLPPSLLAVMAQGARGAGRTQATAGTGPWRLSLELPVFMPFMQYSTRRDLRERLYRAYVTRASGGAHDNTPLIDATLRLRAELASLLGYQNYAEVSLVRKMADGVAAVDRLLADLRDAAWPAAKRDLAELQAFADAHGGPADEPLRLWDVAYWTERLREERFGYRDEDLRPYFQFPRVLDGLFALTGRLFGVRFEAADGEAPGWHPDVRFFRVLDAAGAPLAAFFVDPYSRPETKRDGAWMDPALPRDGVREGAPLRPLAYLVCNQSVPVDGRPSLMTFREVETLFHEFGHGLQHMLTAVGEPEAAGLNNIEWDAVELASQFMENWCYHRQTLQGLSAHVETGAGLPDELFDKVAAARVFRAGTDTLRQLYFGMLDMELHARYRPGGHETPEDAKRRIAAMATLIPPLPEDRFLCGFTHIFSGGYAAGYYSYKWSEVLSADAFAAFEEAGLQDPAAVAAVARRYRDTVLALGGGTHPAEVFRAFRGRDPSPEALLRHSGLRADDPSPAAPRRP